MELTHSSQFKKVMQGGLRSVSLQSQIHPVFQTHVSIGCSSYAHLPPSLMFMASLAAFRNMQDIKCMQCADVACQSMSGPEDSILNKDLWVQKLCLLRMSEVTPMNSHQHGCPNMSWTKTAINMQKWIDERSQDLNATDVTTGSWGILRMGGIVSPRKNTPIGYTVLNGRPWKHSYN